MRCLHLDPLLLHLRKIIIVIGFLPPAHSPSPLSLLHSSILLPSVSPSYPPSLPPSPADAQLVEGLSASVFVFFSAFSPAVQLSGTVLFPLAVCLLGEALVPVWCVVCGVCVCVVCFKLCSLTCCSKLHHTHTPHTHPHTPYTTPRVQRMGG